MARKAQKAPLREDPKTTIAYQQREIERLTARCEELSARHSTVCAHLEAERKERERISRSLVSTKEELVGLRTREERQQNEISRLNGYIERVREKEAPLMTDPSHSMQSGQWAWATKPSLRGRDLK